MLRHFKLYSPGVNSSINRINMESKNRAIIVILSLITIVIQGKAQTGDGQETIEMLFPGGKTKALILSFDDGRVADRRLVTLLNKYGLAGTFHLNSKKLGTKEHLTKEEIKELFNGHEVSVHAVTHPNLTNLARAGVISEVLEDRKELERLTGNLVRGMAYPFGKYNDSVVEIINGLGIEYARTVEDTYGFGLPEDFLKWHPTIHQFGKTDYKPNDTTNDESEMAVFFSVVNHFLKTDSLALREVWGHSWENDDAIKRWSEMENFFNMVSKNHNICYSTQIALADYIAAFRNLKFSVDKSMVTNLSSICVFIKKKGKAFNIEAGSTKRLF